DERLSRHGFFTRREESRETEDEQRHRGVVDRDVDEFAAADPVAGAERCEDRQRRVEATRQVRDRDARDCGSSFISVPRDRQDACERFEVDVVPGKVFVRTVLAEPGERTIDQLRVQHREGVVVRAETRHDPGPELLHEDVRVARELPEDLLAFGGLQVDREGTLAAVHHHERIGDVADDRWNGSHVVADFPVFDLDRVRAEVRDEQAMNIARLAPLIAGFPESVPGTSVNRMCASGLQAFNFAAMEVMTGQNDVVIAGGVESMSRVPLGSDGGALSPKLLEKYEIVQQGISADLVADKYKVTREQMDEFSLWSHRKAIRAIDEGRFKKEI